MSPQPLVPIALTIGPIVLTTTAPVWIASAAVLMVAGGIAIAIAKSKPAQSGGPLVVRG